MARVFDEADYRRRLDAAAEIPIGQELRLLITGGTGALSAQKAMDQAKQDALRRARKELMQRIQQEQADASLNSVIPVDVTEIATDKSDEFVSVDPSVGV